MIFTCQIFPSNILSLIARECSSYNERLTLAGVGFGRNENDFDVMKQMIQVAAILVPDLLYPLLLGHRCARYIALFNADVPDSDEDTAQLSACQQERV